MRWREGRLNAAHRHWLGWANWVRWWHRMEVEGLDHLDGTEAKMIVGYHARGFAWDLIALNAILYERHGEVPISILHTAYDTTRYGRFVRDGLRCVTSDGPELAAALAAGRHLVVLPGGNREANRHWKVRYVPDWGGRTGFLKLALKYDLPVVLVGSAGVDWAWIGLNDGYALGRRLKFPDNLPAWIALGPLGLNFWSPTFPVKFNMMIREPIDLRARYGDVDPEDADRLLTMQRDLRGEMESLLDRARAKAGGIFNTKSGTAR